ncbi:hypothetical protein GCK72_023490 [Caenorhabditis remanei]|uniref:Uncharacterized protein n=1 Tax=Caenorhabditis remanei TaxID=31234 RepID=A0A6A5FWY4_CAERE|nr:hypothetical protein GCK72_023490 [Caenorhabditis remanei]KAF1747032.1 hypothetical protein GCK72_023490 [Caenorhabditis remanei]
MEKGPKILLGIAIFSFILGSSCFGVGFYSSLPEVEFDLIYHAEDYLMVHSSIIENRTSIQEFLMPVRNFTREQVFKLRNITGSSIFLLVLTLSLFLTTVICVTIIKLCCRGSNSRMTGDAHHNINPVEIYEGYERINRRNSENEILENEAVANQIDEAVLLSYQQSSRYGREKRRGSDTEDHVYEHVNY